jgi:hypothetical protein
MGKEVEETTGGLAKVLIGIMVAIIIAVTLGWLYLLYETWHVFGFWRLLWTGLVSFFATVIFVVIFGAGRKEKDGKVVYNPKEFPKFIGILVSLGIGYYLYTYLEGVRGAEGVSEYDYYFCLWYLILLTALPSLWAIYKLIRDRNDYVEIGADYVAYRDNSRKGKFDLSEIVGIRGGNHIKSITLVFKDKTEHEIKCKQMNFSGMDTTKCSGEIRGKISEENKAIYKSFFSEEKESENTEEAE